MNLKIISMPGRFIVGQKAIACLGTYMENYGKAGLLIASDADRARVEDSLKPVEAAGYGLLRTSFCGECCYEEVERIQRIAEQQPVQSVIGLGGGKAIDTAKIVAKNLSLPMIIVPTIAATDAVCSSSAIVYSTEHVLQGAVSIARNPDVVLADSAVIAAAPLRFLSSGIGDAYATYFEARACAQCGAGNLVGGMSTYTALQMSRVCLDILLQYGGEAVQSCKSGTVSEALENVIEANMLLSGIGFESAGLSVAHGIHDAMTVLPETHAATHGEKVAIGVLVQHVMEDDLPQFRQTAAFFRQVGLPVTYSEIGITEDVAGKMKQVVDFAMQRPKGFVRHLPFEVTSESLFAALMRTYELLG